MKANQAYKADEEAVSPVVGVILMVAITVVLAAVVFVLVNNLGKGTSQKPAISYQQDTTAKTVTVVKADTADWKDVTLSFAAGSHANCQWKLNAGTATTATGAVGGTGTAAVAIKANDQITISESTVVAGSSCIAQLTYTPTNEAYGSWTFTF